MESDDGRASPTAETMPFISAPLFHEVKADQPNCLCSANVCFTIQSLEVYVLL
jgi:hypothetical protein